MNQYIIVETDDGFAIETVPEDKTPVAVAKEKGVILIDEGPYHSFDEAQEVLATMPNPYEAEKQSFDR